MNSQSLIGNQFKLGRVVCFGFGTVIVVMAGVGIFSKLSMNRVAESSDWVKHTYQVTGNIDNLAKALVDAETGQRGFIFTGEERFLEPYTNALGTIEEYSDELKRLTSDNPNQQIRLEEIDGLIDRKLAELAQTISLKRTQQEDALMALVLSNEGKDIMDNIRVLTDEMKAEEETLLKQRDEDAVQAVRVADSIALGGTLLAISVGILALAAISRQVILPIRRVSEILSGSSSDMTSTAQEQEVSAQQQAVAVQQTSTTMEELKTSSLQSSEHADMSASAAKQVMELANSGTQVVEHTIEDMETICRTVEALAEQIKSLDEQSQQIAGITEVVSDLANQTNMLSLNASVEAVRAGEHGKGFAVVAGEIRKLADQSKGSTENIKDLIASVQTAVDKAVITASEGRRTVEQGAQMVKDTASIFLQVVEAIDNVANSSEQISVNTKQQVGAIQQVVDAITVLNHEAKRSANGLSQTRANAEQLNEVVLKLQAVA